MLPSNMLLELCREMQECLEASFVCRTNSRCCHVLASGWACNQVPVITKHACNVYQHNGHCAYDTAFVLLYLAGDQHGHQLL